MLQDLLPWNQKWHCAAWQIQSVSEARSATCYELWFYARQKRDWHLYWHL